MIWTTWRQLRTQAWVTAVALGALGVALLVSGLSLARSYSSLGLATCGHSCSQAVAAFQAAAGTGLNGVLQTFAGLIVIVVPPLLGVFWGAPLVARELEAGTHRVAWTQSVTRDRWLATKLAVVGASAAGAAGLLSWAVTAWAHHVDTIDAERVAPSVFAARGVVPVAYALFAFVLGVTLGLMIRRTVPAMAATLGIYAALLFTMTQWVRRVLVAPVTLTRALDVEHLGGIGIVPGGTMTIDANTDDLHGWVLSSRVLLPGGQLFHPAVSSTQCGPDTSIDACRQWLTSQHLVQQVLYQPESRFWTLQWHEAGIFAALAVLLAAFCFWWVRRVA
ncbi:MAG: ABC transporter permease subunit [Promicromonosporaceae bacterium]|nr:ABC transporter permease subunit [Promicromonosporaceae bacterium]